MGLTLSSTRGRGGGGRGEKGGRGGERERGGEGGRGGEREIGGSLKIKCRQSVLVRKRYIQV